MKLSIIKDPGGSAIVRVIYDIQPVDGSYLIVPADTVAFFVCNGQYSDPYPSGRYTIKTGTNPFFVRLTNIMTGGDPAVSVSVFFVSCMHRNMLEIAMPEIRFRESHFGMYMKAKGSAAVIYSIREPQTFINNLVGFYSAGFSQEDIQPRIVQMVLPAIRECIERELGSIDISTMNKDLSRMSNNIRNHVEQYFHELGLMLHSVSIQGINIPPEEESRFNLNQQEKIKGMIATDVELDNQNRIYGTVDKRIQAEFIRGLANSQGMVSGSMPGMYSQILMMPYLMQLMQQNIPDFMNGISQPGRPEGFGTTNFPEDSPLSSLDPVGFRDSSHMNNSIHKPRTIKQVTVCPYCGNVTQNPYYCDKCRIQI